MSVAAFLLLLVLLLSAAGAFLPQLSPLAGGDAETLSAWMELAADRYGRLTVTLARLGLFALFRSPTYAVLLGLVGLSTLVCTVNRWRGVWHQGFRRRVRRLDAAAAEDPHTAILAPVAPAALQTDLEQRGYRVRTASEEDIVLLHGDRYGLSSIATLVTHLAVILLLVGFGLSHWLGWEERGKVAPHQTVPLGRGTGLSVRNDGFAIVARPDGSVADYRAEIALLDGTQEVTRRTVRVNHPLRYRGLGVYLLGFQTGADGATLALSVGRDPGTPALLVGGLLLVMGMTLSIYLPRRQVLARLEPDRLLLRIRTGAWGGDADAELAALKRALERC